LSDKIDMTWEILREFKDRRTYVEVKCGCGSVETRRKDHVLQGRTKRCKKCSAAQTLRDFPNKKFGPRNHSGVGDISKTLWGAYKAAAKKREIQFEISIEYGWRLFITQNRRCALSGEPITLRHGYRKANVDWKAFTASLDRIDFSKGYVEGNVQWVHEDVNYIKRDMNQTEFINWCKKIGEKNVN
jgi:hypothetical protein